MDRLDAAVQAVLVIGVLALEVLRAQQQTFAPENFARHVAVSPQVDVAKGNDNDELQLLM
jgi:hypothetical protein